MDTEPPEPVQLIVWSGDDLPKLLRAAADWLEANPRITVSDLLRSQRNDEEHIYLYFWPHS